MPLAATLTSVIPMKACFRPEWGWGLGIRETKALLFCGSRTTGGFSFVPSKENQKNSARLHHLGDLLLLVTTVTH